MGNPFKFGTIVTGDDFVDREKEIGEIVRELRSGTSVLLYSARRMGKSSLLAEVVRRHSKDFLFCYVDFYGVTTKTKMLERFASAVVSSMYGTADRMISGLTELVRASRLQVVLTDKGAPAIQLSDAEPRPQEIEDVLDLPEKAARKRKKRAVMILDEFQEVGSLDGVSIMKTMRSRFQTHKQVAYVFSGSKRHLLFSVFEETEGAFYRFARPMELGPIGRAELEDFLVRKFRAAGGHLPREAAGKVAEVGRGCPYYVQMVAHELYNISKRPRWPDDVYAAIDVALEHQSEACRVLWDSVKSPIQRRYLMAVALEPGVPHGIDFVQRHGLRSPANVQKCRMMLDRRGITDRGEIVDPMFMLWLQRLRQI